MSAHIVVVESRNDWKPHYPGAIVVSAKDYLGQAEYFKLKDVKVINLCRSYRYLNLGHYCSLLAEARKHKVVPSVRTITELSSKAIYSLNVEDEEDLDQLIQKSLKKRAGDPNARTFEFMIFFGLCEYKDLQELARELFDLFRCPLLKVEFRHDGKWRIATLRPGYINNLTPDQESLFIEGFNAYLASRWQAPRAKSVSRYDLAVLHNPNEKLPPSSPRALQKIIKVGKQLGVSVDLIERKDYSKLAEYDALFIRETTGLDHYTYRFAKKAESEGMVVIDDPDSILKCTNKVYLGELLVANKVPTPKTIVLQKGAVKGIEAELSYPIVLKIPDGSFSRGVFKADDPQQLETITNGLFKDSDLILAQEFVYTEFDWRVGVLNRQPIFVCQYFMSKKHWQVVKHSPNGEAVQGGFKAWRVEDAPPDVVRTAIAAANLIGDGLYGVDIKQTDRGIMVIEVNDNPNVDAGIEDLFLGDELYKMIIQEFIRRLDQRRQRREP